MGRICLSLVSTVGLLLGGPAALSSSPQAAPIVEAVPDHHHATFVHPIDVGGRLPVLQGIRASPSQSVPSMGPPIWGCLTASEVATYARGAGFPDSVIPTMVAISYRESHWCSGAINPSSGACGLFQIYECPGPEALNPATNAALAYAKYEASGLAPWGG